jgi:lysophospholipase L1-like esterase
MSRNGRKYFGTLLGTAPVPSWFPLNWRTGFMGDSITNGSTATNSIYAFPWQTCQVAGTLHVPTSLTNIKGTPGQTSAQMLARFSTDIMTTPPNVVVILAGTNDCTDANAVAVGDASTPGTYAYNIAQMVALAAGRTVIIVTPPPRGPSSTGTQNQRLVDYRTWILANAPTLGYRVADAYNALNNGSGVMLASCNSGDDVHPNNLGHQLIAALVGAQIAAALPARTSIAAALSAQSRVSNGLFSGTLGGAPTGWFAGVGAQAAIGTASTNTIVAVPAGGNGQAYRMDLTAAVDSSGRRATSLSGFTTGDKLLLVGQVKVTALSGDWSAISAAVTGSAVLRITNGISGADLASEPAACAALQRQFAITYTVGAGVTNIVLQTHLACPTGAHIQADFFEFGAYNLTTLGYANRVLV